MIVVDDGSKDQTSKVSKLDFRIASRWKLESNLANVKSYFHSSENPKALLNTLYCYSEGSKRGRKDSFMESWKT